MNKKIFATLILGITVATTFQMCKKPAIKNEITKNEIENSSPNGSGGISVSFKAGHKPADCGGVGEMCFSISFGLQPCHIACIGKGEECEWTLSLSSGIYNGDGSLHDGEIFTGTLENDSIFIIPGPDAPKPIMNTWKSFSINTTTSGQNTYINIPEQNTEIRYTSDSTIYYVCKNITYTSSPAFTSIY